MSEPRQCPVCGAELVRYYVQPTMAYPECWVWACGECEYQEEPQ